MNEYLHDKANKREEDASQDAMEDDNALVFT